MTEKVPCPRCQIGFLQPELATYSCVHHGMLLSVPRMPAWKCDICQYQEFDYDAMTQIEALAGDFGVPDDPVRPASKQIPVDADVAESNLPHRAKP